VRTWRSVARAYRPATWVVILVVGTLLALALDGATAAAAVPAKKASKSPAAGYIGGATTVTSVSATVTLPTFTCTSKSDALSTQIAVLDTVDDEDSAALLGFVCSKKKVPIYGAEISVDGTATFPVVAMSGGDTVVLSATCSSVSGTTVSIDDTTSDSSGQNSSVTPNTCSEEFVGDIGFLKGAGKAEAPLPAFGAIDFSNVMVNGGPLGALTTASGNYNEGKKNVITTGALTDGGTAFTTTQG
jgi:hypothetical protein